MKGITSNGDEGGKRGSWKPQQIAVSFPVGPCGIASIIIFGTVNTSRVVNIEDLRRMAQRRLPRSVFDYLDGGAEAELTLDRKSVV